MAARENPKVVSIRSGKRSRARAPMSWKKPLFIAGVALGTFCGGMLLTNPRITAEAAQQVATFANFSRFPICDGPVRRNCVVDGDTFWMDGARIRVADIDTPEISEPRCDSEYALGIRARDRFQELLNLGPFEVSPIGSRDEDGYGRKLRVVTRGGHSLGDQLVQEGLARTWTGQRQPWC